MHDSQEEPAAIRKLILAAILEESRCNLTPLPPIAVKEP